MAYSKRGSEFAQQSDPIWLLAESERLDRIARNLSGDSKLAAEDLADRLRARAKSISAAMNVHQSER